ncbi:MAG: DUF6272 family protein [Bacteroidales bacterium]
MKVQKLYSFVSDFINYNSVNDALTEISNIFFEQRFPNHIQRTIYMISAECFDNIYKHAQKVLSDYPAFFEINCINDQDIEIRTSNPISAKSSHKVETYIRFLNYLSQDELKTHYFSTIRTERKTKKGGAGLGLLILRRKTHYPFDYSFELKTKKTSVFSLKLKISLPELQLYRIQQTEHTPLLQFDFKQEELLVIGQSRPEDADGFYMNICAWIHEKKEDFNAMTSPVLVVDLEYYNSASLKNLVRFVRAVIASTSENLRVNWGYDGEDELSRDDAVEISKIVGKDFILIEK